MRPRVELLSRDVVERVIDEGPALLADLGVRPAVHYGGDDVQFNPCSTALTILDSRTQRHRPPVTADLVRFVKLVETHPQMDAQGAVAPRLGIRRPGARDNTPAVGLEDRTCC